MIQLKASVRKAGMDEVPLFCERLEHSTVIQKPKFAACAVMQYGQSFHSTRMTIMNMIENRTPSRLIKRIEPGTRGQQADQATSIARKYVNPR